MSFSPLVRQFTFFLRKRAVRDAARNLIFCTTSTNLAEKQTALAHAVMGTVKVLNREIGKLGGGSVREILKFQELARMGGMLHQPFIFDAEEKEQRLKIIIGRISFLAESQGNMPDLTLSIAFSEGSNRWDYLCSTDSESILSNVLEFTSDEIQIAVRILSSAILILNDVYKTPDSPLDLFATYINQMQDSGVKGPTLLTEKPQDL